MITQNIFTILTIFIVVSLVIYFFYNSNDNLNLSLARNKPSEYFIKMTNELPVTKKKVRFDDNIQYNYYKYPHKDDSHRSPKLKKKLKRDKSQQTPYMRLPESDSDSEIKSPNYVSDTSDIDSSSDFEEINIDKILSETKPRPIINLETKITPSNLEVNIDDTTWDSSFGLPLMSQMEKSDYFAKMMDNHKKYDKSMGEFYEYLTDQSTVIKTDTTIDPFKPSVRSSNLKGKAISDIYDEQVAGPQAKPKKIKFKNEMGTTYVDESDMNGGKISGTNLFGFTGYADNNKSAMFGNEF